MTVEEIKYNIHYNENLIDEFRVKKNRIQAQILELETLLNKYIALQERFDSKLHQRKSKISPLVKLMYPNQIMGRYIKGMQELLEGTETEKTREGLWEARRRIKNKIMDLERVLEECERTILYRRERRDYWRTQLAVATVKEV